MGTLTAQPPKYSVILELDRRIRDMPLPKYAQQPPPSDGGLAQTMSHYMPINYLHLSQLFFHVFLLPMLIECVTPSFALRASMLLRHGAQRPPS